MAKSAEEKKIETIIANQNKLLDAQLAKEEKLKKLQQERTGFMEREADSARKAAEEAKNRLDMTSEALQMEGKNAEEREKHRDARLKALTAELAAAEKSGKLSATELSEKKKLHTQLEAILKLSEEDLKIYHEKAKAAKELADLLKKQKEAAEGLAVAMEDTVGSATGISNAWEQGTGVGDRLAQAGVHGTKLTDVLGGVTSGLMNSLNPANLLGSTIKAVVGSTADLFTEMDQSLATFRQQTGLPPEFEDSLTDVRQEMVYLGAQTEDIADAFGKLAGANSAFVFQSAEVQKSLLKTTTALKVAYDAEHEFAEAVGFSMTAMAESPAQAEKTAMGLAKFAKDIKASPKEMMADYASLGPRLAAWGKNATKVFKETAAAAKALNIESAALLDIAGQFDTFDEAAGHVGQLNAMLGGDYFDTVEMVNASESERIELLMEGVRATGKSWDSLGRFERKAVATAAGISDMAEANKMFGQGLDVYKELQGQLNNTAMTYNDLSDAAIENMSITAKQEALWRSLALSLEPFIDVTNWVLGILQKLAQAFGALTPPIALFTAWLIKNIWAQGLVATWTVISTFALNAWTIATVIAEIAVWGLTAAFYALISPIGLFILAIAAVIGVVVGLVYYWDELTAYTKDLTGGLFDMWDVLSLLLGPIGLLIIAGRKLSQAWGALTNDVGGMIPLWESIKLSVLDFVDSTVGYFVEAWQGAVLMWDNFWSEMRAPINDFSVWFNETWDNISNYLKQSGSWMDALLVTVGFLLGPAGMLIAGAALVVKYWEPISDLFSTIGDKISSIVDKMSSVRSFFSGAISSVGSFFSSLNPFSDGVANNKDGSDNFVGTSIINEGGMPEQIVTNPDAMNIVSNENLTRQIETNERVTQAVAGARKAERTSNLWDSPISEMFDKVTASLFGSGNQQPAAAMAGAGAGTQTQVIMEIDGEKFGKVVIGPYLEKVLKPKVEV